jgi:hypothetical protein
MKLGIVLPYSGADMSLPMDRVLEAERLGFDFGLDVGGLWFGCRHSRRVGAGADHEDQGRYCDNADAGTHTRHDRDDDARRPVPIGSGFTTITMGIDEVARFAARPSRWPVTTMTSTVRNALESIAGAIAQARGLMHRAHDAAEKADTDRMQTAPRRCKKVTEDVTAFRDKAMAELNRRRRAQRATSAGARNTSSPSHSSLVRDRTTSERAQIGPPPERTQDSRPCCSHLSLRWPDNRLGHPRVVTSTRRPPATMLSIVALASPARTSSTSSSIENPCASMSASGMPSRLPASSSSARRRVAGGLRLRFRIGGEIPSLPCYPTAA